MIHHEAILHDKVAQYIKRNYPDVMFRSNMEDGRKRNWSERQNIIKLNSTKSWPDIFIAEARDGFHGLFIELKADNYTLYLKKDGSLSKSEHVQRQAKVLEDLVERGYGACFAQGFDQAKTIIDEYLDPSQSEAMRTLRAFQKGRKGRLDSLGVKEEDSVVF